MRLYDKKGGFIADIELRVPPEFDHLQVFRVAVDKLWDRRIAIYQQEPTLDETFIVVGFMKYKDGAMLVEGSLDDLDFAPAGPLPIEL